MLRVNAISVRRGDTQVIWSVSLEVGAGEVVSLMGPNGAGKSTVMNAISGLIPIQSGSITFAGTRLDTLPAHRIGAQGLVHVLERRRLFPQLTVLENLMMGSLAPAARQRREESLEWVTTLFPRIRERLHQRAQTLSGGEQQMVAIARGLMARPRLLMIDEPFLGLAPQMVDLIAGVIREVNRQGVTVLFIEQNVNLALQMSDRAVFLVGGRVVLTGCARELLAGDEISRVYGFKIPHPNSDAGQVST